MCMHATPTTFFLAPQNANRSYSIQDPRLDFATVLRRATRTTRLLQTIAVAAVVVAVVASGRAGGLQGPAARKALGGVAALWARVRGGA